MALLGRQCGQYYALAVYFPPLQATSRAGKAQGRSSILNSTPERLHPKIIEHSLDHYLINKCRNENTQASRRAHKKRQRSFLPLPQNPTLLYPLFFMYANIIKFSSLSLPLWLIYNTNNGGTSPPIFEEKHQKTLPYCYFLLVKHSEFFIYHFTCSFFFYFVVFFYIHRLQRPLAWPIY